MILTDYFKAEKLKPGTKCRFDIKTSTGEYDHLNHLLINKRSFNVGGLSFNLVSRPDRWTGKATDMAITKGSSNITSVKRPDPTNPAGYGDINGTKDGLIILFNADFKENGITTIELFIARGLRNDTNSLWGLYQDGELVEEMETLRQKAVTK